MLSESEEEISEGDIEEKMSKVVAWSRERNDVKANEMTHQKVYHICHRK